MKTRRFALLFPLFFCGAFGFAAQGGDWTSFRASSTQTETAESSGTLAALSADEGIATVAREKLRACGQPGLDALLAAHSQTIAGMRAGTVSLADEKVRRLRAALDAVAQQRDAFASGLFWFTDFEEAKAAARAAGKPILSLRLLGNLDTELSCANSRFFRTTLYPNRAIAALLRDHFILHWKSVRPVPRVTIDFGDGRRLERTITGNSAHYIMDADGAVIDALPGLFGAKVFQTHIERDLAIFQQAKALSPLKRFVVYAAAHREALRSLEENWDKDLAAVGMSPLPLECMRELFLRRDRGLDTGDLWKRVAALHRDDARLEPASRRLLRAKNPTAKEAGLLSKSKVAVESPLLRALRNLEDSIAEDTVRNEYLLHGAIREWLAGSNASHNVEALNRRVYAELFLTPEEDPWLGLAPRDAVAAIEE